MTTEFQGSLLRLFPNPPHCEKHTWRMLVLLPQESRQWRTSETTQVVVATIAG